MFRDKSKDMCKEGENLMQVQFCLIFALIQFLVRETLRTILNKLVSKSYNLKIINGFKGGDGCHFFFFSQSEMPTKHDQFWD